MKLYSIFKIHNYIRIIKSFVSAKNQSRKVIDLLALNDTFYNTKLLYIWDIKKDFVNLTANKTIYTNIFGTDIKLNNLDWHLDYVSGFEYPLKRFDKLIISKWFNNEIDVKFPWELSRFYFAVQLAQNYMLSKEEKYYLKFKEIVTDWISKNPFCYGVNWRCTMEVGIRAINWIVAINLFKNIFDMDNKFKETIIKSLVQHAEYISYFPEIYDNNHTTNHTTADYTGLLFLSLSLNEHPRSSKWLKQALDGLEGCIRYQTYEDGVNFEGSIPYHRLVLEMFAYSAIAARANSIKFSKKYYDLLFKMFEYSAAYMDHSGNAPQVGDNDSGRILIFHESDEHDHSYLLDIGENIFDYAFKSQCKKRNPKLKAWLPTVAKIDINHLGCEFRETEKSIAFEKGGAYFLKNEVFSLLVSCFPIGQNGKGGHSHRDTGSFVLSIKGEPIIVDPGTYTYTRSYADRNLFRDSFAHNISVLQDDINIIKDYSLKDIWRMTNIFIAEILEFNNDKIKFNFINKYNKSHVISREISIINNTLSIIDNANSDLISILHFTPDQNIKIDNNNIIVNNKDIIIKYNNIIDIYNNKYNYSYKYGIRITSCKIIMIAKYSIIIDIIC